MAALLAIQVACSPAEDLEPPAVESSTVEASEALGEMVGEFGSVLAIDHAADFTEIDMRVDRQAYENCLDSFALFGIAIGAGFDQHFSGADADSYRVVVNTIDDGTDGFFDTFVLPDDWQ